MARILLNYIKTISFPGSKEYWEERYASGGTSGAGSYGKLAKFKADVINSFVKNNKINSVIEFGCGDGNQLSLFDFPAYIGLDISKTSIELCMKHFKKDRTKSFFLYDSEYFKDNHHIFKAELALSLDVIYHLVEENIFELYMKHLFSTSDKFVIIYSSDTSNKQKVHQRNRQFTKWVKINFAKWKLIKKIKNKYPNESGADFFIYKKAK
ncbi:MAG: class I SAM-dependent methyltransferase [Candidatus Pacearchaeota archaeon]|nr:MAG: class I SAM-dependent methyltransferase [Candidatus Pacearchaeota archaeon]